MYITIEVNQKSIRASKGDTILTTLRKNGIDLPTLCHMKEFTPTGACRLCVVEIEGMNELIPACSYPVNEWIKISTHSPRILKARRTILELLLDNHPDDCLYCGKNKNCELQDLAEELHITERRFSGNKNKFRLDQSSPGIVRDPSKCILCGRCVRICEEKQSVAAIDFINRGHHMRIETAMSKGINVSSCIQCGQCIRVCPTGALYEKNNQDEVLKALHDKNIHVMVQYAPSVSISIGEAFGIRPGKDVNGLLNAALRKMGVEKIFLTSFAADLASLGTAAEFREKSTKGTLPLFSSCCPSWVKYIEQFRPEYIDTLSTCKSPQQMLGGLIKSYYAETEHIPPEQLFSVAVMPCTSKKFEAQREEMNQAGIPDIDVVITTRELIKMIQLNGIDLRSLEGELPDNPFGTRSSAGKIYARSGGVCEALIRTLHHEENGMDNPRPEIKRSHPRVKEYAFMHRGKKLTFVVVSGIGAATQLLNEMEKSKPAWDFIEVMACEEGCIAGGGQPLQLDDKTRKTQLKTLQEIDGKEMIHFPAGNPAIMELFERYFQKPMSMEAQKILHTTYAQKDTLT